MVFEYMKITEALDSIDIEDEGNTYIKVSNDDAFEWYLGISTELGWSRIQQYGPLKIGENDIGYNFFYSHSKSEVSSTKLYKTINDFINQPKRNITSAEEINKEEFNERLANLTYAEYR